LKRARGIKESEKKLKALYFSGGRMDKFGYNRNRPGRIKRFVLILSLPFLFFIIAYLIYKLFFIQSPVIEGVEGFELLPVEKSIVLKGKYIKSVDIIITQGERKIALLKDTPESFEKTYNLLIRPRELGLKDGSAKVVVKAVSGVFRETRHEINSIIDTVPPSLEIVSSPFSLYQGTGGFAVLTAKDADSVSVRLNDNIFRAFKSAKETDSGAPRYSSAPADSSGAF
jgi:hypothetical protein